MPSQGSLLRFLSQVPADSYVLVGGVAFTLTLAGAICARKLNDPNVRLMKERRCQRESRQHELQKLP